MPPFELGDFLVAETFQNGIVSRLWRWVKYDNTARCHYPIVNYHSRGKSTIFDDIYRVWWRFSMVMLVYWRVDDIFSYRPQVLPSLRQPRGQAELEEMLALPEARWKVLNLPPVERETNGFSGGLIIRREVVCWCRLTIAINRSSSSWQNVSGKLMIELFDDAGHFVFVWFCCGWQWQDQLIFEFTSPDGSTMMATPQEDRGGRWKNPWVGLVSVAVTFQSDFESKCACPKFQQESQTAPPLSKIYSMFCKNTNCQQREP